MINSYLLYKMMQIKFMTKPLTHLQFRRSLVRDLVEDRVRNTPSRKRKGRPSEGPLLERLNGKHFLKKRDKKKSRCVVCSKRGLRRETCYSCKTCTGEPALHPEDCFEDYHSKEHY
ncbi:hypothetical protein J6590_108399 [Homalodisca vitripennis]|nr:hypothetical protein J6590_108399 [Homalodisca vitripennis]